MPSKRHKQYRQKFVFSVNITPELGRKLRTAGGANFGRNVGALLEVLDEAGFFDHIGQLHQRTADAIAAVTQDVQRQARREWLEAIKPYLNATAATAPPEEE